MKYAKTPVSIPSEVNRVWAIFERTLITHACKM